MAKKLLLGVNVYEAAIQRMVEVFKAGHRVVVSFSAGKDSGVCVEVCLEAMRIAGVGNGGTGDFLDVSMRDEEVMYPGTFEYAERIAKRDRVRFHWLIANQPIINVFNRAQPYWWVFDPELPQEEWVRQPPSFAEVIPGKSISAITGPERFPPPPGKNTYVIMGLRTSESTRRLLAVFNAGGPFSRARENGMVHGNPIYDWKDDDVWLAIHKFKWDYNEAYDVMHRIGIPKRSLRIAPPTMTQAGIKHFAAAARAWPHWFDKVAKRIPGARSAAQFGPRACLPHRRLGETWQQCFLRECITDAPAPWIRDRAVFAMDTLLRRHAHHSEAPWPEVTKCMGCGEVGSWQQLAHHAYNGDPFALRLVCLQAVEPDFFRSTAGKWEGSPTFA